MDNAERIYQELRHEQAAIWYISDEYGSKIMIKAPSTTIKALVKETFFDYPAVLCIKAKLLSNFI